MTANDNDETSIELERDESTLGISRRNYVRGVLGTAAAGAMLSWTAPAAAETTSERIDRYLEEFGTVIDMAEAGADTTGRESVSSLIREHCGDDTLLLFPPGRYYMDEQVRFSDFEKFGLVGNGATLVPADYHEFDGPTYRLFRMGTHSSPGNRLVFDGFTVDQTAPDTGIRVVDAMVADGLEVRDVTVEGRHDSGTWGPGRFNVTDPDGTGIVERFEAPDGGAWESETPNAGNIWRGPTGLIANMNRGRLTFKDCAVGPFPDNGLYACGDENGTIVVDGGRYENSHGTNLRIGGSNSVVRGATVRIDETPPQFGAQRAVRLENGESLTVEDTDIAVTADNENCHAMVLQNTCGEVWIEDVSITIDTAVPNTAILVSPGAGYTTVYSTTIEHNGPAGYGIFLKGGDDAASAHVQDVDISGDVGDDGASSAVRNLRDGVRFLANAVDQPGGDRRYGLVNLGDDCTIYRGVYRSSLFPVLDAGVGTWVEDVYANSYGEKEAYCLHDDSADVYLKTNRLVGGYADFGCDGLRTVANEF